MTKKEHVLKLMQRQWVTPMRALMACHCFSLSQRAGELKREGYKVVSRRVKGQPFHEYRVLG